MVEHVLVIALVALAALGSWTVLGENVSEEVRCTAGAIGGGPGDCGVIGAASADGDATAAATGRGRPATGTRAALGGEPAPVDTAAGAASTPSSLTAQDSYESRLARALDAMSDADTFDTMSGGDDHVSRSDLEAIAAGTGYDAEMRAAAQLLLASPAAMNALDVAHGGDVDDKISSDDVRELRDALAGGDADELRERLADTASGEGEHDGQWSQEDLDALAEDPTVPESVRSWARGEDPNVEHGCGWYRVDCHVAHGAEAAWDATDGAREWVGGAATWTAHFGERLNWMTQPLPPLDPRQWGDWAQFKLGVVRGMGDWVVGTGEGIFAAGKWLVTSRDVDAGKVWDVVQATPGSLWNQVDTFATGEPYESGRAGGALALDVATVVIPGGAVAGRASVGTRLGRFGRAGRVAAEAELATDATVLRQSTGRLRMLYRQAARADADLDVTVREVAAELDGTVLDSAGLKGRDRVLEKVDTELGGDASRVLDLSRRRIMFDDTADIYAALGELGERHPILRVKDQFVSPKPNGFRSMLVNLRMPNGHIAEVQLHTRDMMEAMQRVGDDLYHERRVLEARGAAMTEAERARVAELLEEERELYRDAWQRTADRMDGRRRRLGGQ